MRGRVGSIIARSKSIGRSRQYRNGNDIESRFQWQVGVLIVIVAIVVVVVVVVFGRDQWSY